MALYVTVLALLLRAAQCVQPKELEHWLSSPEGLGMSATDAEKEAEERWQSLTQCGVTVKNLQALKDTMANQKHMALDVLYNRHWFFKFAEHHVNPSKVTQFYDLLSSGYTLYGGLAYDKNAAQEIALEMVDKSADPDVLYALYRVMYGYDGLGFSQDSARHWSIQLAEAGANATAYKEAYQTSAAESPHLAVAAYLSGLERRYAKDGKAYIAEEFYSFYTAGTWMDEWISAPLEKRLSADRRAYTANQFSRHWPSAWVDKFKGSKEVTQVRLANDGKAYTIAEFRDYYADKWQRSWADAPELACKECAPYAEIEESISAVVV